MAIIDVVTSAPDFDMLGLWQALEAGWGEPAAYDALPFGVVAMDLEGTVVAYNKAEAAFAGVNAQHVIGLSFFNSVAPCTNNYLVAGRFEEESQLDETIKYTFTVKMRPTKVQLRMLKREAGERQYLAVKWD